MSEELKPCPFCGEHVELKQDGVFNFIVCMGGSSCKGSGLVMFFSDAKREEAIAAWNQRAQPTLDEIIRSALGSQASESREAFVRAVTHAVTRAVTHAVVPGIVQAALAAQGQAQEAEQ